MECTDERRGDNLFDYFSGNVECKEAEAFEKHLEECAYCRKCMTILKRIHATATNNKEELVSSLIHSAKESMLCGEYGEASEVLSTAFSIDPYEAELELLSRELETRQLGLGEKPTRKDVFLSAMNVFLFKHDKSRLHFWADNADSIFYSLENTRRQEPAHRPVHASLSLGILDDQASHEDVLLLLAAVLYNILRMIEGRSIEQPVQEIVNDYYGRRLARVGKKHTDLLERFRTFLLKELPTHEFP